MLNRNTQPISIQQKKDTESHWSTPHRIMEELPPKPSPNFLHFGENEQVGTIMEKKYRAAMTSCQRLACLLFSHFLEGSRGLFLFFLFIYFSSEFELFMSKDSFSIGISGNRGLHLFHILPEISLQSLIHRT